MASKPNRNGEQTLHQPIGSFYRNVSAEVHYANTVAALQPGYEPEGGPEDDDHEEDDRVDDDELFNFRLHLNQFDPDDHDSEDGGDSDVSQVGDSDEEVGLGSV